MGNDANLFGVLAYACGALGIISFVLYARYWVRDYPGDPERPPHFFLYTLGLIVSLSIALPGCLEMFAANAYPPDFRFSEALNQFLRFLIAGVLGLVYDVVSRQLRRRRQAQRQRSE